MLGRVSSSLCDHFYCLTDAMAEAISSQRVVKRSKIRVIHNGIDIQSFVEQFVDRAAERNALGIPQDAIVVGTVGRLTEIKRQDVLIRAFAKMRLQYPSAHLVLVGAGPLLDELKGLSDSLGISPFVHFAGYQPHSGRFLRIMDVFVLSSRSEGMPQAVLEASVCELPVIASQVGGLPEVIEHDVTGSLFAVGDEDRLAGFLCDLAANPSRRRRLGRAARARVESRYSIARMAGDYHRDFLELLGHRGACTSNNLQRQLATPVAAMEGS